MPGSLVAHDVRLSGFSNRAPLSTAWRWLDAQSPASLAECVPLTEATGRVLAAPVLVPGDPPIGPRSAENGYAVRSADCDGAAAYNPLVLPLLEPDADQLAVGFARLIASGMPMPSGADAVLPFEAGELLDSRSLEVLAPVARGTGIERPNALLAGTTVLNRGQRMRPQDVGLLAAMGVVRVTVLPRPRVAIVVPGAKSGPDALTPMLRALLARDGALVQPIEVADAGEIALATALTSPRIRDCAVVLVAGRAGCGPDDTAAQAVEAAGGTMALHGVALRPGGTIGLGTVRRPGGDETDTIPVVLLPGEPLACLVAYDMLAARLVRRLTGADAVMPYPVAEFELGRKIVSGIGIVDIVPVILSGGVAVPIGADAGFAAAARADGFVVVAEASEGYPAAGRVLVHLYDVKPTGAALEMGS